MIFFTKYKIFYFFIVYIIIFNNIFSSNIAQPCIFFTSVACILCPTWQRHQDLTIRSYLEKEDAEMSEVNKTNLLNIMKGYYVSNSYTEKVNWIMNLSNKNDRVNIFDNEILEDPHYSHKSSIGKTFHNLLPKPKYQILGFFGLYIWYSACNSV